MKLRPIPFLDQWNWETSVLIGPGPTFWNNNAAKYKIANMKRRPTVCLLLVHRMRHWPSIKQAYPLKHETLNHCWFDVGPPFTTLAQYKANIGPMSRGSMHHNGRVSEGIYLVWSAPNTRRGPNVGVMLGQRRRRWPNITPTLV